MLYAPDHDHSLLVAVNADGSFRLDGVPSGRYELMGQRSAGTGFVFNIHHLAPGDTIDFGELRLPPAEVVGEQARRPAAGPGGACDEGAPRTSNAEVNAIAATTETIRLYIFLALLAKASQAI